MLLVRSMKTLFPLIEKNTCFPTETKRSQYPIVAQILNSISCCEVHSKMWFLSSVGFWNQQCSIDEFEQ